MSYQVLEPILRAAAPSRSLLHRKSSCGGDADCADCKKKKLQRLASGPEPEEVPSSVHDVLRSPGEPLDAATRAFMEPRFGHDFTGVRVHTDSRAAESAMAVKAEAYTVGNSVVFNRGKFDAQSASGRHLLSHELAHVVQQRGASGGGALAIDSADSVAESQAERAAHRVMSGSAPGLSASSGPAIQRKGGEPYIKKISIDLTPKQSATLEWEGTPPADAVGSDSFTVSTGKGYADPGDPAGTCLRTCCSDAENQCTGKWTKASKVGACCTFTGDTYYTGKPRVEHNGWKWWTPIEPPYKDRGIALHQHTEVTGQPIGHGCVRMAEANAKRIYDFSKGWRTKVVIGGKASPVQCKDTQTCTPPPSKDTQVEPEKTAPATTEPPAPGKEQP